MSGPQTVVAPSKMVVDGGGGTQAAHASEELVWRWKTERRPLSIKQFALNEPLLALRSSVLRAVGERAQLQSHLLEASRMARKAGHLSGAASVLHEVRDRAHRSLHFSINACRRSRLAGQLMDDSSETEPVSCDTHIHKCYREGGNPRRAYENRRD